jgi:hypothetical protein
MNIVASIEIQTVAGIDPPMWILPLLSFTQ